MCIDRSFATADAQDTSKIHRFTYRLVRSSLAASVFSANSQAPVRQSIAGGILNVGDPVLVSMEHPDILAVARGFVLELSRDSVMLGLDHALTDLACASSRNTSSRTTFRVDKDELASGLGRLRDNLAQLFYAEGDHKRRNLIVDMKKPRFERLVEETPRLAHLNADQQAAVDLVLKAQDYALILGMPGTGKTTTIAEIILALVSQKKSVLLTSYTHSAVDNILLKLLGQDINILRLGNQDKVLPQVQHLTLAAMEPAQTVAELEERFMSPQVVATTALGISQCVPFVELELKADSFF
jgi:DNA replication ATP-dependent helicase Dna2